MKLRFIGTDGSMGLKHGEVRHVRVLSSGDENLITVTWYDGKFRSCPYSSLNSFCANWEDAFKTEISNGCNNQM